MKIFKLLWRLFRYRPWLYILNIIVWAIIELIPLLPGLIIKKIFDSFSVNAGLDANFWWLIIAIGVVYLLRILFVYGGTVTYMFFGFSLDSLMRQNLLKSILRKPGAQALSLSSGDVLNRFRDDVPTVQEMFDCPLDVFGKLLCAIVAVGILYTVDAHMTLFVFLPMLVVLALVQQVRKKLRKYRKASREATGQVIGALGEMFNSVQAIKAAGAEEHIIKHFQNLNNARHKATLKDTVFVKVLESALNNVVDLGTGLILLLAAKSMRAGTFSVGDFALFTTYWFKVADFTNIFGELLSAYQQARVSFERLIALFDDPSGEELVKHEPLYLRGKLPEKGCNLVNLNPFQSLEVKNLSYYFPDSENGIENVSFTVERGSFTVITGRIGSGKSTLLRVLQGLLPCDNGTILWNGAKVSNPSSFFIPPRSAYTGQVPTLFSDTIRNNILLGVWDDKIDIQTAVHSAVLEEDLAGFEDGLETMIGTKGVKLSGGQIQRVAAARMFANQAQLYIFDDISSALDIETENILWERLFERSDATCIVVSNRRAALQQADRIIVMRDGKIVGDGTLDELLDNCEDMQQIYIRNSQIA